MAQLTVRKVSDAVVAALKERARKSGRSAEAEHRRLLEKTLLQDRREEFFDELLAHRVKLPPGEPSTTEILRRHRSAGTR